MKAQSRGEVEDEDVESDVPLPKQLGVPAAATVSSNNGVTLGASISNSATFCWSKASDLRFVRLFEGARSRELPLQGAHCILSKDFGRIEERFAGHLQEI